MKKSLSLLIIGLVISAVACLSPVRLPVLANTLEGGVTGGIEAARGQDQPSNLFGDGGIFQQVTNILLFIIGVLSVIMLIYGGIRYVVSGGDAKAVEAAKNTILYAIVGLIVAILAFAIVNFVVGTFIGGQGGGTNI